MLRTGVLEKHRSSLPFLRSTLLAALLRIVKSSFAGNTGLESPILVPRGEGDPPTPKKSSTIVL